MTSSGFTKQNKMAAELSTLVSSFLDTKPETYATFFLDCVNAKQHLNTEKIPDGWLGKVNTFLNSKTDSWLGVCLLGITVEQCDTDTFTKNCASWIRTILQLIQSSEKSNVIQYSRKLIDDILQYAVEFSELSRELSNSVIPAIISSMLSNKCTDMSCLLSILSSCIHYFPGSTGPCKSQIENFVLPLLNSSCEETRKSACHCYALLPRCSRSGNSGKKQACPWETQWNKVLYTIHKLLDAAYENVEPVSSRASQNSTSQPETLPLGEIPQVEPSRTHTLITRCNTLLNCLSAMIREDYLKVFSVPIDASVSLLTRILSVTNDSLKNAVIVESVLLRASLPLIHANAVDLLRNLITRCGSLMLPYCDLLMRFLVQELTWTKCQDPKYGHHKPYRHLRCSVYLCLEHWVQLTNSLPEGGGVVTKLMQHLVDDIKPLISQTKLLPSTNAGNPPMSKKAKKRKLKDDVDQLLTGQQKFDMKADEIKTYRALRALSAVLVAGGSDIPQDVFREIQVCIIKLVIQCQQSPYPSYPIPFSSAECRQALYHVLLCFLLSNTPHVPSPINHAVKLFSGGLQDADLKVSSFCREALAVTNSIIHPRSFPQVCSAPGPLLAGTSEHPSVNDPVPGFHHQDISELQSSSSLNQMRSENTFSSQQSIFSRGAFGNVNSVGYSQIEQNVTGHGEVPEGGNDSGTPLINISNKSMEKSQDDTAERHVENSNGSEIQSQAIENEKQCSKAGNKMAVNINSETSGILLSASSSNTSTAQLLNKEGFITANTSKTLSLNSNCGTINQKGEEDSISFHQKRDQHDLIKTLGKTDPKRRRVDDNSNVSDEQMYKNNHGPPTPSEDHLSGGTEKKKDLAIEDSDSDETSKMLASFVDSYPDSDDQEIS